MQPDPESLLGRPVVDARGNRVGTVLDVGTGEQRAAKFLLVGAEADPRRAQRVEIRDVAELAPLVRLRARA